MLRICFYRLKFIFLFLLFLQGCATTSENKVIANDNKVIVIPDWVQAPQKDSSEFIYGIGVGRTIEVAKQNGLKEIASKFSISVNSETLNKQSVHNERSDALFTQEINTHVKEIEFSHFVILKTEVVGHFYYLKVGVSRQGFIKDKKSKLASITNKITLMLNNVDKKTKIERLYIYNKIQAEVVKARPLLYLISVADTSFDLTSINKVFQSYAIKEKELLLSTRFHIQSMSNLQPVADMLKDVMQLYGFQVTGRKKSDAIVKIKGKVRNAKAFSTYNSRINFSFLVGSKQGQLHSKKSYIINGASISNYENAYGNAVKKFSLLVQSRSDLYDLLGFDG